MRPRPSALPPYSPQLATLVRQPPEGDQWLHEIKYDGYRMGCLVADGRVRLISRRGKDWSDQFPEVVAAASALPLRSALLDGEVAVVSPDGRTDFHALQGAGGRIPGLAYFVFDLLHIDGVTIAAEPLEARKARIQKLIGVPGVLRYSDHVVGNGAAVFAAAQRLRTEGVVSKLRAASHRPGRSSGWLKTKAVQRQEFVIGGHLETAGAPLASLLAGYYDDAGALCYAGKVGTGFQSVERELLQALRSRVLTGCPFAKASRPTGADFREARWVQPELVAEIEFLEWTPDLHLRHPSFKGLRSDKAANEVRREVPEDGDVGV